MIYFLFLFPDFGLFNYISLIYGNRMHEYNNIGCLDEDNCMGFRDPDVMRRPAVSIEFDVI
jgi:hypothetical protein